MKEQAGRMESGEVRALMKASDNRTPLLEQALADKDDEELSAVLGAPPMLSRLTREVRAVFLRKFNAQRKPETVKRLRALTSAKTYLEQQGGLVFKEVVKAVGGSPFTDPRTGRVIREDGPQEIRKKREASADVYAKHG